ncbi:DUF3224 domain-containing protein [Spongiactinospora gelatinilytica]|uniref:DUF3224 domain-containing protein n=1 Tax=Spongiactinospora gelatinilytica TaxID=2666298 RepID=A0A2W2FUT0_9ACTN|nr:DUF3224 domain-containing protein [Spongiactinospora gelatinilytica]PZG32285.1 DUF3224 domain-containing protein [Spongiactinospora gelatinilytica]
MVSASGVFNVDTWDEDKYDQREGAKLAHVRVGKTFQGDLEGTSTTDIVTVVSGDDAPLAYSGIERFTGAASGRQGSFVLQHTATAGPGGEGELVWRIVTGTGTGELTGIRGEGRIDIAPDGTHSYVLEYELG